MAQGTEVAIQPVGVGVSLSIGEVLDPLNDLIERFSGLALLAAVSLGLQISLAQLLGTTAFNIVFTLVVLASLACTWLPIAALKPWQRGLNMMIAVRFIMIVVLSVGHWIDVIFLEREQQSALREIKQTTQTIEDLSQTEHTAAAASEESFYERTAAGLSNLLNSTQQTLDLKQQFKTLQNAVEESIVDLIHLAVIFTLQTLVIPLIALVAAWQTLRFLLRHLITQGTGA